MFDYNRIDSELRAMGKQLDAGLKTAGEENFRAQLPMRDSWVVPFEGMDNGEDWLTRPDGSNMRLRIYRPLEPQAPGPAVLWCHGGGYATGVPEISARTCKRLIDEGAGVVVVPDHRLSVEASYPAALEDCRQTLYWLKDHAEALGGRSDQLMVGGESSGGGLAIALTLMAREQGDVSIAFQMPIYPMIDDRMTNPSAQNNEAPGWNSYNNREGWRLYLGDLFETDKVPVFAAPARNRDFSNLPPAVTFVGDLDPFLDETIAWFDGLKGAGIPAECHVYQGCYHGFDMFCPDARVTQTALDELGASFRKAAGTLFKAQP